jgi:hypothetical protein
VECFSGRAERVAGRAARAGAGQPVMPTNNGSDGPSIGEQMPQRRMELPAYHSCGQMAPVSRVCTRTARAASSRHGST